MPALPTYPVLDSVYFLNQICLNVRTLRRFGSTTCLLPQVLALLPGLQDDFAAIHAQSVNLGGFSQTHNTMKATD